MTKELMTVTETRGAITVHDMRHLIDDYIRFIDAKEATITAYASGLKRFFSYLVEEGIAQPGRKDVIAFREALKTRGLKANSIHLYIVSVRRFFQWTAAQGYYPDITQGVKGVTIRNDFRKEHLTAEQLQGLFNGLNTDHERGARDAAILALMATAGLRTVEIIRADIGHMEGHRLYVHGKGRDEADEYIKLSSHVADLLQAYLETYRRGASPDEALFTSTSNNNRGGRLTTRTIRGMAKKAFRDIGLDSNRHTAHSLRHSAATINLENGGSLEETQGLLRHSNINTPMIYLHHMDRARNESEQRISNVIFA